jgi:hypothetical protein
MTDKSAGEALLPCPNGHPPRMNICKHGSDDIYPHGWHYVECTERGCGWHCGGFPTEAEVIAAWNLRASPQPSPAPTLVPTREEDYVDVLSHPSFDQAAPVAAGSELETLRAYQRNYERESNDIDRILARLGLTVDRARTECGALHVPRILNHIQETLDALAAAHNNAVAMSDKYCAYVKANPPRTAHPEPATAEPVAWSVRWEYPDGGYTEWLHKSETDAREKAAAHRPSTITPLYPPSASAPSQPGIAAWETWEGEGDMYELRRYENNENYRDEYIARNGQKYAHWIKPLYYAQPSKGPARVTDAMVDAAREAWNATVMNAKGSVDDIRLAGWFAALDAALAAAEGKK